MVNFLIKLMKFGIKATIVVAGIAVIVSYARLSEFGDLRKELMQTVEQSYVGRLRIDGPIELQMSFPPSIAIKNVTIKNAKWGKRPEMLTAETLVAEVDLLPLLRGEMAVPRLRMIGVDIVVETHANGKTNWDELNDFETAAGPAAVPNAMPSIFPHIGNAALSVSGGSLTFLDSAANTVAAVSLSGADLNVLPNLRPCP